METNEITSEIIGCAIAVHRTLGPGLLESVYRVCLAHELTKKGLTAVQEKPIPVLYDGVYLDCGFRADLIVESTVIVECKAKEKLHEADAAQMITYLKLTDLRVGLLINFHEVLLKNGIKRFANGRTPDLKNRHIE